MSLDASTAAAHAALSEGELIPISCSCIPQHPARVCLCCFKLCCTPVLHVMHPRVCLFKTCMHLNHLCFMLSCRTDSLAEAALLTVRITCLSLSMQACLRGSKQASRDLPN